MNPPHSTPALKPIKLGLLWHSSRSGNLGVGALTIANMALIREQAEACGYAPRFTIIGMRDTGAPYVSPAEADEVMLDTRALLSPGGCWAAIKAQDGLLDIGAGDSFAEIYGPKRFLYLWATKAMALLQGRPLLLSPQTIGPFTKPLYRALARMVMTPASAVVARDKLSLQALNDIAPKANGVLSVDVAFALPFPDRGHERGGTVTRLGINVSGLLYNEARSGRNSFGLSYDYAEVIHALLDDYAARPDVQVHLITHVVSPDNAQMDDDGAVADNLAVQYPTVIRAPTFAHPSDAKSYISSLDMLFAARMHACIGALSAGTPVVPMSYSRKFSGLFGLLEYPWMVPAAGMTADQVLAYLNDAVARRAEIAKSVVASQGRVQVLLDAYRAELRRFLERAGRSA